jgi:hypothetical protein
MLRLWIMKNIIIVLFIFLSILSPASAESVDQEVTKEKLSYNLLSGLLAKGTTPLKGRAMCESFVTGGQDTVGRFISWSLSFYHRGKDNSILSECKELKGQTECTVYFAADSKGESPWACGLRFKYNPKKSAIDFKSIECVGTC